MRTHCKFRRFNRATRFAIDSAHFSPCAEYVRMIQADVSVCSKTVAVMSRDFKLS
jgi:hypothetical protein